MKRSLFPALIILILGCCYSLTIAPDLTWAHFSADGGDLITAAATGGVPHPGGYPLYMILARLFQLLPVGSLAFRTNLLSAVCTVLTALLLYQYLSLQLTQNSFGQPVSFLASLAYGLAPFVWGQSLVTEVYALHGFLMMLCLYALSLDETKISEGMRGLVFGLAATNHLTSLLLLPLLFLNPDPKTLASPAVLFKRSLGLIGGLSLYLILPVRASFTPPINWVNASTLEGFLALISGQMYQKYSLALSLTDIVQRMRASAGLLLDQYTIPGVLLGIYALLSPLPRRILIPTTWMGATFLLFSIFYGSFDSQVNLMPLWLVFPIWMAHGLQNILSLMPAGRDSFKALSAGLLFIALVLRIPNLVPEVNLSHDTQPRDFIARAAQTLPENALVFMDGDEQIFSLWYMQFAQHQRPDLVLIANGLVQYDWYRDNLAYTYPDLVLPQADYVQLFAIRAANAGRPPCSIPRSGVISCSDK